jgi:arylsulfatase A-like enzyme
MAISQAPWTLPAMASIHTGLYPWHHGATHHTRPLAERFETLAERLHSSGYATWAVVSTAFVSPEFGMGQGFDLVDVSGRLGHRGVSSPALTTRAITLLREKAERPFFLWVHYFDPHYSYHRHPEHGFVRDYTGRLDSCIDVEALWKRLPTLTAEDRRYVIDTYDEEVAFTDLWIGRLLDALEELDLRRSTMVVLVADHGEELFERGNVGHGNQTYQELIRVPLIVADPRRREDHGTVVAHPVETRSVFHTVLAACGLTGGPPGTNLLGPSNASESPGVALSEGTHAWNDSPRKLAVVHGPWKLNYQTGDGKMELYDLHADPGESRDLAADPRFAETLKNLEAALQVAARSETSVPTLELEAELLRELRTLGYVE